MHLNSSHRAALLALSGALAMHSFANAAGATNTAHGPVVATDSGKVEGAVEHGVASWKGIPFAAAPSGALRWRAPQPPAPWSGVRQATSYGADCMQKPFPSDAAPLGTAPAEDCLFVNVWRPAQAKASAKLPVLVWIYGGGFVNGGSSPPTYSGAPLAQQGVLLVSFNYRLGRFGFFAHPQLTAESPEAVGNYAFMDQVAALQWVKRNAAAFGGDPAQVTIIGESAGGMAVNTLLTSPLAQGLFARAVIMSGGDGATRNPGLGAVEKIGTGFASAKGIAADDPQALAKLRALPADQVIDNLNLATMGQAAPTYAGPFVDGKLAVDSAAAFNAGRFAKVPVMIGATSADIGGKTGFMLAGARSLAATLADQGVPVYAYRFSYVANSIDGAGKGAGHATDIPFFFHTEDLKYADKTTARDKDMGRAISAYIVNFAKKGDPNGGKLPAWPRYARADDTIMDFAASGKPVALKDPWGAEIEAARTAAK